jgi:hypothetical protein
LYTLEGQLIVTPEEAVQEEVQRTEH